MRKGIKNHFMIRDVQDSLDALWLLHAVQVVAEIHA